MLKLQRTPLQFENIKPKDDLIPLPQTWSHIPESHITEIRFSSIRLHTRWTLTVKKHLVFQITQYADFTNHHRPLNELIGKHWALLLFRGVADTEHGWVSALYFHSRPLWVCLISCLILSANRDYRSFLVSYN